MRVGGVMQRGWTKLWRRLTKKLRLLNLKGNELNRPELWKWIRLQRGQWVPCWKRRQLRDERP
jgi:hypothetical protein